MPCSHVQPDIHVQPDARILPDARRPGVSLPFFPLDAADSPAAAPLAWQLAENRRQQAALERLIGERFASDHGARISHFLPRLAGLWQGECPQAAVGAQSADVGTLFLETYLDRPIEALLDEAFGQPVSRDGIVEIGNLACARPGLYRPLILHLIEQLYDEGHAWLVFTATPAVRNGFRRLGLSASPLALADPACLPPASRAAWGRYYDLVPWVMGGSLTLAHAQLASQGLLPSQAEENAHVR
ncbi:thermostable hemolysin [Halomonas sp. YLGW01]|uniref:thermostable hemolysin n=1 Tax=Halomonas sp. YLGW01 TaxID=2773308 RepID=UPI0017871CFE|nr:thermostable hemolysin [Halomonas sp. YLGW01]